FEVLYINSPFNPLSYSNEDLYLRSLQIFVLGIKYFILACLFLIIDHFAVNTAIKLKKYNSIYIADLFISAVICLLSADLTLNLIKDPFILIINAKIVFLFSSVFYLIKYIEIKESWLGNDAIGKSNLGTPKNSAGKSNSKMQSAPNIYHVIGQLNLGRILFSISIGIAFILNEFFILPIAQDYITTNGIPEWNLNMQFVLANLLYLKSIIAIGFAIEFAYSIVITSKISSEDISNINTKLLIALSVLSLFYFGEGIWGFIIYFCIKNRSKIDEKLQKMYENLESEFKETHKNKSQNGNNITKSKKLNANIANAYRITPTTAMQSNKLNKLNKINNTESQPLRVSKHLKNTNRIPSLYKKINLNIIKIIGKSLLILLINRSIYGS
ncbi:MAG: hypothetical protein ACTSRZ_15275, partial [Promethearchaeota archaeon]